MTSLRNQYEGSIYDRQHMRFFDPLEYADFSSWALVISTIYPCPNRRPSMHTVIDKKWMLTEQHPAPFLFALPLYGLFLFEDYSNLFLCTQKSMSIWQMDDDGCHISQP